MSVLSSLSQMIRRRLTRRAQQDRAAPASADNEDPISQFADALRDQAARGRLEGWRADVLAFADMMDGITWDGLLVSQANHWDKWPSLLNALERMGEPELATLVKQARQLAVSRGHADEAGCDPQAALDDDLVFQAFQVAEKEIESRWEGLWDRAEAYARSNGWSP